MINLIKKMFTGKQKFKTNSEKIIFTRNDEKPSCIKCDYCISGSKCEYCGPYFSYVNYQRTVD